MNSTPILETDGGAIVEEKQMMNKEKATNIFENNSCLIAGKDVIPISVADEIVGPEAVKFAKKPGMFNAFAICDSVFMPYLTKEGFLMAVTYLNVKEYSDK